jgi:hypothetical protein
MKVFVKKLLSCCRKNKYSPTYKELLYQNGVRMLEEEFELVHMIKQ